MQYLIFVTTITFTNCVKLMLRIFQFNPKRTFLSHNLHFCCTIFAVLLFSKVLQSMTNMKYSSMAPSKWKGKTEEYDYDDGI